MTNPFESYGQARMTSGERRAEVKRERHIALSEKEAPMVARGLQKKMQEQAELAKEYRKWRAQLRQELIDRHGDDLKRLMRLLRGLEWLQVQGVVDYVRDAWWLRRADEGFRQATLSYIDDSICRARVRYGIPTIDDGLPGELDGPFIQIRKMVVGY